MNPSLHASALAGAQKAFRHGDYETMLQQSGHLLRRFSLPPFPLPVAGGFAEIDHLLHALGQKMRREFTLNPPTPEGGDWILASCIHETGGNTPLMRDLAAALPRGLSGIVLTLTGHDSAELTPRALERTGLPAAAIHRADAPTLVETCRNVLRIFETKRPRRLFLFQFPEDTTAIAAAAALLAAGTELWLVHHADGLPTAGLFLPGVRILDLTPRTCAFTRHVLGLRTDWLPLTCPDPGLPSADFLRRGRLTTALSGSIFKTTQETAVAYPEVVATVLRATGGTHLHIGPLKEDQRVTILNAVVTAGLSADQFVHVPVVPTLAGALRSEGVDLLLNSWPYGGARTAVEAAATGIPMAWHSPHPAEDRWLLQMAYPGAPVWRSHSDLVSLVTAADAPWLKEQSRAARTHYERSHHPDRWRQFFSTPEHGSGDALPEGFDATLFLPLLWRRLVDQAIEIDDAKTARRLRKCEEKLSELAETRRRLRKVEAELDEARFPWPIRLYRRWKKRRKPR